jgi:HSP20 family molecular chaperone IbpA
MKVTAPALTIALVTAVALPAAKAWSYGPGYFVRPGLDSMLLSEQMFRRRNNKTPDCFNQPFTSTRTSSSPRYEITNNDEQLKISLGVPGVVADDITVAIEDDGKVLSISGRRERFSDSTGKSSSYTTRFSQSFLLDPTVDIDKFTANLKNGVLVVMAPKDLDRLQQNMQKIPVVDLQEGAETQGEALSFNDEGNSKQAVDDEGGKEAVAKDSGVMIQDNEMTISTRLGRNNHGVSSTPAKFF